MRARLEVLLAVGMTVGIEGELAAGGHLQSPAQAGAAALITLPLAVRFRWPLVTIALGSIGVVAQMALSDKSGDPILGIVAALLALYAVGSRTRGWRFWLGGAIALAAGGGPGPIPGGGAGGLLRGLLAAGGGLFVGRALRGLAGGT